MSGCLGLTGLGEMGNTFCWVQDCFLGGEGEYQNVLKLIVGPVTQLHNCTKKKKGHFKMDELYGM